MWYFSEEQNKFQTSGLFNDGFFGLEWRYPHGFYSTWILWVVEGLPKGVGEGGGITGTPDPTPLPTPQTLWLLNTLLYCCMYWIPPPVCFVCSPVIKVGKRSVEITDRRSTTSESDEEFYARQSFSGNKTAKSRLFWQDCCWQFIFSVQRKREQVLVSVIPKTQRATFRKSTIAQTLAAFALRCHYASEQARNRWLLYTSSKLCRKKY